MKVRKKPIVIDAEQLKPITEPLSFKDAGVVIFANDQWYVNGLNGLIELDVNDWVLKGTAIGDYYPCKPDVFADLFERVE